MNYTEFKMKKVLILLLYSVSLTCLAQNNIIQINQSGGTTTSIQRDCDYKINGICSSEDIGGVSLEEISRRAYSQEVFSNGVTTAYLKNYNNFAVTVLIELNFDTTNRGGSLDMDETYQVVIQSGETKGVELRHCNCPGCYSLKGMIVRRLKN